MRASLLATLLTMASAVAQIPSSDVSVGVFPFLEGNMDSRISEIVTNCQTRGIDTVYVSVFRATGPSTGDLWVTDSAGDWNATWGPVRSTGAGIHLQNLITACHAQNIRVVGVMKCFSDTVQPTNAAHKQYLLNVIDYFVNAWKVDGTPVYENVAHYLPKPIEARSNQWISPVIITVRDMKQPKLQPGLKLGRDILKALGMQDGFTHMEWFLTPKGEAVFGEIGCRPGGAHLVDQMNYTSDIDLFREWARVACYRKFEASTARKYNVGIVFKRAQGEGRIRLGGDIMIHGSNVSIGCLAMGDPASEELFVLAALAGPSNVKVILSPIDFRKQETVKIPAGQPDWVPALHEQIKAALSRYP
jgi:hypothetical protein